MNDRIADVINGLAGRNETLDAVMKLTANDLVLLAIPLL